MENVINDDDGRMAVTITSGGAEVTRVLDVYLASDQLNDIARDAEGKPNADYWKGVAAWAEAAGFPGVSARTLDALTRLVFARAELLRGKPAAGSGSAA